VKKSAFAAILFTFGVASASAADLSLRGTAPYYPVPVWSWTGFYIGADVGYGWSNVDHSVTIDGVAVSVPTNAHGFTVGIYGGYNWQFNQFVAGVETDISWANITATNGIVGKVGVVPFAVQAEDTLRWLGTTRARLGFLPVPSVMLYGSVGVAYGGVDDNVIASIGSSSISSSFAQSFSASETHFGLAVGVGAEWAITSNFLTRAEWLHYDLGSTSNAFEVTSRNSGNIVRTGLAHKF
jgi:outer membrane immunogenic protein